MPRCPTLTSELHSWMGAYKSFTLDSNAKWSECSYLEAAYRSCSSDASFGNENGRISLRHKWAIKFSPSSEMAMKALAMLQKVAYPDFSIHRINFRMLIEEQEIEHSEAFTSSLGFVLASRPYNLGHARKAEKVRNATTISLHLPTWRPCQSISVGCWPWNTFPHHLRALKYKQFYKVLLKEKWGAGWDCSVWFWFWW